ncbi:ATP-dependent Clp protease proteolytic subunit [Paraliobacillus ryukyuensis]|uniref:ATP-dependent Clp protease proteolytic subunit n=1 Tax=Paraliobacillus ryukyuensis TaxID=200904 RepID=A0A366EB35_9BACI|nr:head maturation protease, ClpP-related [Paraliobacillus ryukyuensis]RBO99532.1 ATP-dependent protease ClpP protease subunit [Paraliobacillus ryukyuensis]
MPKRINVKGAIVSSDIGWIYELFDIEHTSPKLIADQITDANGEDLEVIINSGGGEVYAASEIYTDLKSYDGNVETRIVGLAASAASVIAMAGDKVMIAPTAEIMIHNASMISRGDHREMGKTAHMLQNTDKTIANAYRLKSGMEEKELLELMGEETWLTPQDALEKGFVDEIMFDNEIKLSASNGEANLIPQEVIDGIRQGKLNKVPGKTKQAIDKETVKQMFVDFKQEILNELKLNNNQSNEPKPSAPTQNKRKGFIF